MSGSSSARSRSPLLSFVRRTLMIGIAAVAAACSAAAPAAAPGSSTAPPSASKLASAAATGTPSVTGTPSASASASARPTAAAAQVDLTFTGSHPLTAKGSAGRCSLGTPVGGGVVRFGFEATEADYPGLGRSFSLMQTSSTSDYVDIKWLLDDLSGGYGRPDPGSSHPAGTATLSPDHHAVTIDVELDQFVPQGGSGPGPEHVSGTINCP